MKRILYFSAALAAALALATVATGARTATPGVTANEVVIGGTIPITGVASAYRTVGLGAAAYFRYVNAHGGVNHRKIRYIIKDDQYDPGQTMDKTRGLVEQDHVFAIFNSLGTEHNLATRPYLNALKVPQLFVASGATTWGKDYKQWPWTIGYQPNYRAEGTIYGRYVAKTAPKSRIGVLFQNDDYGKDLLAGLRNGLGKKTKLIVSTQGYNVDDPNVQSQIAKLKAAKANTLMLFSTPKFTIRPMPIRAGGGGRRSTSTRCPALRTSWASPPSGRARSRPTARSRSSFSRTRPTRAGRRTAGSSSTGRS
jgi:ABC-type branched-subunit amino acid transport system substrate-binding protein